MKGLLLLFAFFLSVQASFCCTMVGPSWKLARTFRIDLRSSGKPLGMGISISNVSTGKIVRKTKTDANGRGEIRDLEPGTYNIISPVSQEVVKVVSEGGTDVVHMVVAFDPPIEADEATFTITDKTGAVIPRADVVLEALDDPSAPVAAGTTDAVGSISLSAPYGDYILRVARAGFKTVHVRLRLTKSGPSGFTLVMSVAATDTCSPALIVPSIEPQS